MIKHLFKLTIRGVLYKDQFSFSKVSERFRNIQISPTEGEAVDLVVFKRRTIPIELSTQEAKIEANDLADRLCLIHNQNFKSLYYIGYYNSNNELIPEKLPLKMSRTLFGIVQDPENFYQDDDIKAIINGKSNTGVLRIYRTALGISDRISQYLIFYGLLSILKSERQKELDKFIINQIPDILIVSGKQGDETIITNIRNMIAHPDKDLDMTELNKRVDNYLDELRKLVFSLLK